MAGVLDGVAPEQWRVLGLPPGNYVSGDPEAIVALSGTLRDSGIDAQDMSERLLTVYGNNVGTMRGGYVPGFERVLSELPQATAHLAESHQAVGSTLNAFAGELEGLQSSAADCLETGTQADEAYKNMLTAYQGEFARLGVETPAAQGGDTVWRGLGGGSAQQLLMDAPGFAELEPAAKDMCLDWACQVGNDAAQAEASRQEAGQTMRSVMRYYEISVEQCRRLIAGSSPEAWESPMGRAMRYRVDQIRALNTVPEHPTELGEPREQAQPRTLADAVRKYIREFENVDNAKDAIEHGLDDVNVVDFTRLPLAGPRPTSADAGYMVKEVPQSHQLGGDHQAMAMLVETLLVVAAGLHVFPDRIKAMFKARPAAKDPDGYPRQVPAEPVIEPPVAEFPGAGEG